MLTATIKDENGTVVGTIVLNSKTFKTGSVGYYGQGKLVVGGKRYQTSAMMVEIGSKPSK